MQDPLENLPVPNPPIRSDERLKLTLISMRRSSFIGLALVVAPALFVLAMLIKYELGIDFHGLDALERGFVAIDRNAATHWLTPVIMVLLPLAAVVVNVLAILHVTYARATRLLTLTVKLKALNLIIVFVGVAVLGALFLYQFAETFGG
jgi:hypothetical protein